MLLAHAEEVDNIPRRFEAFARAIVPEPRGDLILFRWEYGWVERTLRLRTPDGKERHVLPMEHYTAEAVQRVHERIRS